MQVTLYIPGHPPRAIEPTGFFLPDPVTGFAHVTSQVAQELGCAPGLVDILDSGQDFVAYSVFDYPDDDFNEAATDALVKWSKHPEVYHSSDPESQLRGPLLLVTKG